MKSLSRISIIIFLFLPFHLLSQNSSTDSLLTEFNKAIDDTSKANILLALAEISTEDGVWQKYNLQALAIVEKNIPSSKDPILKTFLRLKATALNNVGYDKETHGDLTNALFNYYESLKLLQQINNEKDIAFLLNNIADIYETQGNITRALEYYDKSLKMHEKTKNEKGVAQAYNNIGYIYSTQGELDKALDYYEKSYKIKNALKDISGAATSLSNIGYIYMLKKLDFKAMSYYLLALKMATDIGDKERMALACTNIAGIHESQGDYESALKNFLLGIKISEEIDDKDGISHHMSGAGNIYLRIGKTDSALYYGTKAMALAKKIGSPSLISQAAALLKNTYKKIGKNDEALEYTELYFSMKDSINNEEIRKATYKQQLTYEFDKKEAISKLQEEKKDIEHASAIKRQRIVSWSIGIGLFMLVVFFISLYKRFVLIQKQKKIIEEQKMLVEEKNTEILDSITYAKRLQDAILPPVKMFNSIFPESFIFFQPKDIVAGDFYWLEQKDDLTFFAAADCTGHGVPGAMVSVVCSNALNRTVKEFKITDPGKILDMVRNLVVETFEKSESEVKDGMDISLCCINKRTNELNWSGANNPIYIIRNSELIEYKGNKQPIGKTENPIPFTTHTIQLHKNDSIYIFTDGFADQFGGPKGKKFKYAPFKEMLNSINSFSMNEQANQLQQTIKNWQGALEQVDDILVIGLMI